MTDKKQQLDQAFSNRKYAKSSITRVETFLNLNRDTLLLKYDYLSRQEMLDKAFDKFSNAQDVIGEFESDLKKLATVKKLKKTIFL